MTRRLDLRVRIALHMARLPATMEIGLNGEDLRTILCRLEAGMVLSIPDAWIERTIPGSRVARARLVEDIARQYYCVCHQEIGVHRFERLGFPATG